MLIVFYRTLDPVWLAHESGHYYISLFTHIFYLVHGIDSLVGAPKARRSGRGYYSHRSEVLADKFGGVGRYANFEDGYLLP